jgi:hypothetical protein
MWTLAEKKPRGVTGGKDIRKWKKKVVHHHLSLAVIGEGGNYKNIAY